jgi:hypothetical protein
MSTGSVVGGRGARRGRCLIALCLIALCLIALCRIALCLIALCLIALCLIALCLITRGRYRRGPLGVGRGRPGGDGGRAGLAGLAYRGRADGGTRWRGWRHDGVDLLSVDPGSEPLACRLFRRRFRRPFPAVILVGVSGTHARPLQILATADPPASACSRVLRRS